MKHLIRITAIISSIAILFVNSCATDDCPCEGQIDTVYYYQYDTILNLHFDTIYIFSDYPYIQYISLISQSGTNNPTDSVIVNELDLSINWKRLSRGLFQGKLSKPLDLSKTTVFFSLQEYNKIATGGILDSMTLQYKITETPNTAQISDNFSNAMLEINEYLSY